MEEWKSQVVDFVISAQKDNGSWSDSNKNTSGEPQELNSDIVITSQAMRILAMLPDMRSIENIKRSFYFCMKNDLSAADPIEWWAWELLALDIFDTDYIDSYKKKIATFLYKNQNAEGFWARFPSTFNLTNFIIINSLQNYPIRSRLDRSIEWFRKNKAKDKLGWGADPSASKSEPSFTSNVILSLIMAGEDPEQAYIQKARKYLENNQNKIGGWGSSSLTTIKSTTYSTALATIVLMLTSRNPFNKNVKNGIEFLKNTQKGGWPLLKGGKPDFYTTYYATRTLLFYEELKDLINGNQTGYLEAFISKSRIASYLFRGFDGRLKQRFKQTLRMSIINSKALGSTRSAVKRRREIIIILGKNKTMDPAEIIDELRKQEEYSKLNKKHHITQIKADLEHLYNINLAGKTRDDYFLIRKP